MNELLGFFTAMGVMVAGDKPVIGHFPCEKQIMSTLDDMVLKDEGGSLGENINIDKRESGTQSYNITYNIRRTNGSESKHAYHVATTKDCKKIDVKKLNL